MEDPTEKAIEIPTENTSQNNHNDHKNYISFETFPGKVKPLFVVMTDMKIGTFIIWIASLFYFIATCALVNARFTTIVYQQAKVAQVTVDLIYSIFNLIATSLLIHLSWFDGWKEIYNQLKDYDPNNEPFWKRYFVANKLVVAMWLLWLPNVITFIFPCWALAQFNSSGIPENAYNDSSTIKAELAGSAVSLFITFFWVYASFPEMMRKNKTYGSVTFIYYLSLVGIFYLACTRYACNDKNQFELVPTDPSNVVVSNNGEAEAEDGNENKNESKSAVIDTTSTPTENNIDGGESSNNSVTSRVQSTVVSFTKTFVSDWYTNPFEAFGKYIQRPFFGSDWSVGAAWFVASSVVGFLLSAIDYADYFTLNGLICTAIYMCGTAFIWLGSYPMHMSMNDYVGSTITVDILTFIFCGCGLVKAKNNDHAVISATNIDEKVQSSEIDENSKF